MGFLEAHAFFNRILANDTFLTPDGAYLQRPGVLQGFLHTEFLRAVTLLVGDGFDFMVYDAQADVRHQGGGIVD